MFAPRYLVLLAVAASSLRAAEPPGYYAAAAGLTGTALRSALHDIVSATHQPLSYTATRAAIEFCDEDPANTNNVILVYARRSEPKSNFVNSPPQNQTEWNREHLWPNSLGLASDGPDYADLNNLRAADVTVNNTRANLPFDETTAGSGARVPGDAEAPLTSADADSWEPPMEVKGDIARAIFYMELRYDGDGSDPDLRLTDDLAQVTGSQPVMGRLATLLIWHYADPVSPAEQLRNDRVQARQGNRNPFVDRPTWVEALWGNPAALTMQRTGTQLRFTWGLGLQNATLQSQTSLGGTWTNATGTAGTGGTLRTFTVTPPAGEMRRFFRLRYRGIEAP